MPSPRAGRRTLPLAPARSRAASPRGSSSLPRTATGSDSVAPYGRVDLHAPSGMALREPFDGRGSPRGRPRTSPGGPPSSVDARFWPRSERPSLSISAGEAKRFVHSNSRKRGEELGRIRLGRPARVHVGHDRGHPERGAEQREQRERGQVALAGLDAEGVSLQHLGLGPRTRGSGVITPLGTPGAAAREEDRRGLLGVRARARARYGSVGVPSPRAWRGECPRPKTSTARP